MVEDKIKNILFKIGKEIKIHTIDKDNMVIEIDYDKYAKEIVDIIQEEILKQTQRLARRLLDQ